MNDPLPKNPRFHEGSKVVLIGGSYGRVRAVFTIPPELKKRPRIVQPTIVYKVAIIGGNTRMIYEEALDCPFKHNDPDPFCDNCGWEAPNPLEVPR